MRGGRRQRWGRRAGKILSMLACTDRVPRVCGHTHANMLMSIIKKRMFTLYKKAIPEKKVKNQKSEEPKKSLWSESTGVIISS